MDTHTLSCDEPAPPSRATTSPCLVFVLSAKKPTLPSAAVPLDRGRRCVFGRGERNDTLVADNIAEGVVHIGMPDRWMSGDHFAVEHTGRGWTVTDVDSKNGTFVNGHPCALEPLCDGDVVEAGSSLFLFRRDGAADARPTPPDHTATPHSLNRALQAQYDGLRRIAGSNLPVLVQGESGTGKELAARAVHELSARTGDFVAINCGALPASLIESELFGVRRGAFSGAVDDRVGLIRSAHRGTLFLDEIADLPEPCQAALLRFLQEGEVRAVGDVTARTVDARVVAATHTDLAERVRAGTFRRDLYARLAGYSLCLPALRDRREDMGTLTATLLRRIAGADDACRVSFTADVGRLLLTYPFPLNVRELEHALRAAVLLADGATIELEHLPAPLRDYRPGDVDGAVAPIAGDVALRHRLTRALRTHHGNIAAVARELDKAPVQIRRWCSRLDLDVNHFRSRPPRARSC